MSIGSDLEIVGLKARAVIAICIATYRRPHMLRACIESVYQQQMPLGVDVAIFVIDNDPTESARSVVDAVTESAQCLLPIHYILAPGGGVVTARNAALRTKARFICFIDDDEVARPGWLSALWNTMRQYDADAVFGPVLTLVPESAPRWVARSRVLNRRRYPTGHAMSTGATGNVIFSLERVPTFLSEFNPKFSALGGEDTEFFSRMHAAGALLVWCDDAVCDEMVAHDRLTLRWVLSRAALNGQRRFRRLSMSLSRRRIIMLRARSALAGLAFGAMGTICLMLGLPRAVPWLERAAYQFGHTRAELAR